MWSVSEGEPKKTSLAQTGCSVTVTHLFWEQDQAGPTPVIPTLGHLVAQMVRDK